MHHRAAGIFARAKVPERGDFDIVIVSTAITSPLDRDQTPAEIRQRLRLAQGKADMVVCGVREIGAVAFDAGVKGAGKGIVDNADDGFAVDGQTERDANVRVAVEEIGRAVYGIHDEGRLGGEAVTGFVGFFAHESTRSISVQVTRRDE